MQFEKCMILEEIKYLKRNGCIHHLGIEPSCFEKNSEQSLVVRKQANQLFAKKNHNKKIHEEIWKLYTKSIAYAANESEELAAGYANRSALLLHLKKYNQCLHDIDRALKITNSNALKVKLYSRQSECYFALENGREKASLVKANFWLGKIDDSSERKKLQEIIEKTEKCIETDLPDSVKPEKEYEISCENNAFRMHYNQKYGKHIVADQDISLGELVYVEKFYVTTVNTAKSYAYCSHCLSICWNTIPCNQCALYMYCSEKCKEEAWEKYHDMECAVKFEKHPESYSDDYMHLGLRSFVMGLKQTGSIIKLKELINQIDDCTDSKKKGLTEHGKFSGDSFESLYSLNCSRSLEKCTLLTTKALKILVALAQNTHILGEDFEYTNNIDLMNNDQAIFIASLIFRLSSICLINAFDVLPDCEKDNSFSDCTSNSCCSRGLYLSLFTRLINHSCYNNVDKFYTNDGRVVYYALRPIKKGSQIFSTYDSTFYIKAKADRQTTMYEKFEIHCNCVACKNYWPLFDDNLPNINSQLGDTLLQKHSKLLKKFSREKYHRNSTNTIRTFMEDTELLLKSSDQPNHLVEYFLNILCMMIESRYYVRLGLPNECVNPSYIEPSYFENKNSKKSLATRKQANELFSKKNHNENLHEEVWKLYSKSIAYALNESEELPAGYANRSALLLHLKKYSECLLDIDRALQITDSIALKVKLYCRQSECFLALQNGKEKTSIEQAKFWLDKISDAKERNRLQEIIEKAEKVIKTYIPGPLKKEKENEISCDNNAFRISYNKIYGRHLVADRDIHIGEPLYVENFYVTTVNTAKCYAFCSHCLAISWATIPCDNCSYYMYCSEKCKEEAWEKYHDIECALKFVKHPQLHIDYYIQLALRAFVMGLKEAGSVENLREMTNEVDECNDFEKRGFDENGKFSSDSFKSLYSLSHSKDTEKVMTCSLKILDILIGIAQNTQILGTGFKYTNVKDLVKNDNAIFIAGLLLRLSSICFINAFDLLSTSLDCVKDKDFRICMSTFCCTRGLNISLFTSLINHSCCNNVDRSYTNDGRVVYYAIRPIKKNSQIFSSYYCTFCSMQKEDRQRALYNQFGFHCKCDACKYNWPVYDKNSPFVTTDVGNAIVLKHNKLLKKLSYGKKQRVSKKTINSFIQDLEFLMRSYDQPNRVTEYFIDLLCLMIDLRYFVRLEVPNECQNNLKK